MKLYNKEQRRVLRKMTYRQRKIARTSYYFSDVFGCRLISLDGEKVNMRIRDHKNHLSDYEKYEISGTPRHLQTKPVKLSDSMI